MTVQKFLKENYHRFNFTIGIDDNDEKFANKLIYEFTKSIIKGRFGDDGIVVILPLEGPFVNRNLYSIVRLVDYFEAPIYVDCEVDPSTEMVRITVQLNG